MAPMPSYLSLNLNSSLKPLIKTLPWMILGLFLPLPLPSDYFILPIKILHNDVFHALAGLNPRKAYGPDGVPPIVRNCASVLAPCLVKLFQLCLSTSTFPSCWKFAYIQFLSSDFMLSKSFVMIFSIPSLA